MMIEHKKDISPIATTGTIEGYLQPELPLESLGNIATRSALNRIGVPLPEGFNPRADSAWKDLGGNVPKSPTPEVTNISGSKPTVKPRRSRHIRGEPFSGPEVEVRVNDMAREFTMQNKTNPTDEELIEMYYLAQKELRGLEAS